MKEKALEQVRKLLARRLEAAGLKVSNPDTAFQLQAGEPEPYGGGTQVRVKTWRQWSSAHVKLDADAGEFLAYSVDRFSDPPTQAELTQEQALAVAAQSIQLPAEARLSTFRHFEYAPQRRVAELVFDHYYQGLRVDGDRIRIVLNPTNGRIVELERYWRTVSLH